MLKQNSDNIKLAEHKYTNHLIHENSPYLLQHAHNPVNWYPWGDEALKKAQDEDKLIIISIGYSACHWCHVMAHECFENEEIAKIMNDNFICIKVDREERPDIDNIYMTAVQLITGRGGWPLNCFALPDGKPVYGGTYFRPNDWKKILLNLSESYKLDKTKFLETAKNIQAGIQKSEFSFSESADNTFDFIKIRKATERFISNFDTKYGGTNYSPKFPMPVLWNYFLEYSFYSNDKNIKSQVELTLSSIAKGGIYDQLAGGFSRYSTDAKWIVPHFEKMLYDNAQLVSLYSKAYLLTGNDLYKNVVFQTTEFIKNEMTSPENAFYSSYDADSEGEEGKYYVWTKTEIEALLKEKSKLFCDYYNVSNIGNWENGKNILYVNEKSDKVFEKYNLSEKAINEQKQILLKERKKRVKPGLDDKILTSWNALMISGYIDAYEVFGKREYLQSAENAANFIIEKLLSSNLGLKRSYKNGNAKINAFSDDYVFTAEAFIKLYQASGNEKYLQTAKLLTDYLLTHFYDKKSGMFFYTSDKDAKLTVRQKEISDNVIPASNSVAAKNLYSLGIMFSDSRYLDISKKMVLKTEENLLSNLNYFAAWASLYLYFSKPSYELVIVGKDYKTFKEKLTEKYRPDVFFAGVPGKSVIPVFKDRYKKGETLIYVCRNYVCKQPVKTVAEAEKLLSE
ncbi:MAG: thioredoxin domain-containing protein [Bacteroidales bacterium]|nr:thioredoxin domain-containing protein [Bacteroidales bacterium]